MTIIRRRRHELPVLREKLRAALRRFHGENLPGQHGHLRLIRRLSGLSTARLALAAGRRIEGVFAGGAAFVDLATLTDPPLVTTAILQVLGLRGAAIHPLIEFLRAHLADTRNNPQMRYCDAG